MTSKGFMNRYSELSLKISRKDARKPHIVYDFYGTHTKVVQENNLETEPMYIYNCDKSGFQNDPSKVRTIVEKGKHLSRVPGTSRLENRQRVENVSARGCLTKVHVSKLVGPRNVTSLREQRNELNQNVLLIYDGHASHISIRIIEEAEKANIILLILAGDGECEGRFLSSRV